MDNRTIVVSFLDSWIAQDVELTVAHVADDFVYALHISNEVLPFGGETRGREEIKSVLYTILADFDYLKYEPVILGVQDDVVRVQVDFIYHHRRTGEDLVGTKRLVIKLDDGLIARIDEYHDVALVEAFMRLARQRVADNDVAAPPELPRPGTGRVPTGCGEA
jgi:ketosteroid isomerase-like protein